MKSPASILSITAALCLSGCATHPMPPQPEGRLIPINGEQQTGMNSPQGGCYAASPPSTQPEVISCPRQ